VSSLLPLRCVPFLIPSALHLHHPLSLLFFSHPGGHSRNEFVNPGTLLERLRHCQTPLQDLSLRSAHIYSPRPLYLRFFQLIACHLIATSTHNPRVAVTICSALPVWVPWPTSRGTVLVFVWTHACTSRSAPSCPCAPDVSVATVVEWQLCLLSFPVYIVLTSECSRPRRTLI
jgi:hypothetical protein